MMITVSLTLTLETRFRHPTLIEQIEMKISSLKTSLSSLWRVLDREEDQGHILKIEKQIEDVRLSRSVARV